ncbi:MAG TPA: ABC transporter ATP-binding protein [Desulfatiglandales bacterium]|nr:ABC transporter ATP-binding protein [Desulfatiglandales bacterium]
MALLEVRNLTKRFGGLAAVDGLDFSVQTGELLSIIGPNGAGKTTVFNLLTGFYSPTSGKIIFNGIDITGHKPHNITRKGMGRTFQMTNIFGRGTVLDNVIIGQLSHARIGLLGSVFGIPAAGREKKEFIGRAREILAFVGLEDKLNNTAANITEEAKKRLSIALALATGPKLLLLDEPASGVNLEEITGLMDLIEKIRKSGITVCLIEHKMKMVMSISDRIIVLCYGKNIADGTPKEVAWNEEVINAYLGGRCAA